MSLQDESTLTQSLSVRYGPTVQGKQAWDALDAKALQHWRIALANRNSAAANILHIGDSITWGYANPDSFSLGGRWASVLRDTLRSRFPNTTPITGGFGFMSARQDYTTAFSDATVTNTGGSATSGPSYGLDTNSRVLSASGNTQHYTFTGTGLDLLYITYGGGGTFSYAIDGGAATNINTNTTTNYGAKTQIRGLTAGAHTLDITYVSGGSVFYAGQMVYNGDESAGIRSWVAAFPSTDTAYWYNLTSAATQAWYSHIPNINPDLVTIELGPNDYANQKNAVTTYTANLRGIIAKVKSTAGYIPSFVLVPTWPIPATNPVASWSQYVAALYNVAATDPDGAVCVFDWQARTASTSGTTIGGILSGDKTHLSALGNRYIGEAFAQFISPR